MSTSVIDYVQKNLRVINFFMFVRNFKYQKIEEKSAWDHYLSALEKLSKASDNEIRTRAKRKKDEAMLLKLRKGQLEEFWLNVELENAQASFEANMRRIQLRNQIVDAERHHQQFRGNSVFSECSPVVSARSDEQTEQITPSTSEYTLTDESDDEVIVVKRKKVRLVVTTERTQKNGCIFQDSESKDDDANEKVGKEYVVPTNEDVDKSKLYEVVANDVMKQYITSKSLEDIWRSVIERLEDKKIRVQSIESRIIDLTNWTN